MEWDLSKFEKNKWIELAHTFSTTSEMINPVLKIDMINDASTGFGAGTFYTDDIRIYDRSSLSTEDLSAKIEIFPNPVTNILTIKNIKPESKVIFYNLLGASFKPKLRATANKSLAIDMSNLRIGVYFLKIIEGDNFLTKKIIKKTK